MVTYKSVVENTGGVSLELIKLKFIKKLFSSIENVVLFIPR